MYGVGGGGVQYKNTTHVRGWGGTVQKYNTCTGLGGGVQYKNTTHVRGWGGGGYSTKIQHMYGVGGGTVQKYNTCTGLGGGYSTKIQHMYGVGGGYSTKIQHMYGVAIIGYLLSTIMVNIFTAYAEEGTVGGNMLSTPSL